MAQRVVEVPTLTRSKVEDLGLTVLVTGGASPAFDVVFLHGIQGHPSKTWTSAESDEVEFHRSRSRILGRFGKCWNSQMLWLLDRD